jgi:hypothetical protein
VKFKVSKLIPKKLYKILFAQRANVPNTTRLVYTGDYRSNLVHFDAQKNIFYVKKALA